MEDTDVNKRHISFEFDENKQDDIHDSNLRSTVDNLDDFPGHQSSNETKKASNLPQSAPKDENTTSDMTADKTADECAKSQKDPRSLGNKNVVQEKKKEYITPLENPYEKAWKYLFKHDILSLFQGITADIASDLPPDPIEFMVQEIKKIQEEDRRRKGIKLDDKERTDAKPEETAGNTKGKQQEDFPGESVDKNLEVIPEEIKTVEESENNEQEASVNNALDSVAQEITEGVEKIEGDTAEDISEEIIKDDTTESSAHKRQDETEDDVPEDIFDETQGETTEGSTIG